jgi:hypothetical protein
MKLQIDYVETLANRAEECRSIAESLDNAELRAEYLRLAESYSALSRNEQAVAKSRELLLRPRPDSFLGRITAPQQADEGLHGYRAYIMGSDGHIADRIDLFCVDDREARERAKKFVDGRAVELWDGARKVDKFDPTN